MTLARATTLENAPAADLDAVTLSYEARYRRRCVLRTDGGGEVLRDLAEATELREGHALVLVDGRRITIRAATEPLTEVRGDGIARRAWHIGNRHTPCQGEAGRLLIQRDHVLEEMLRGADGAMTGFGYPEMMAQVVAAYNAGDETRARDIFDAYMPMVRYESQPGQGLAIRKHTLTKTGVIAHPTVRKPGGGLSAASIKEVDTLADRQTVKLRALGL